MTKDQEDKKKNCYSYDNNNNYIYLGACTAKCDGSWICCDSCGGWKCYYHWYEEYGVDLSEYQSQHVDSVYFSCNLCINLIVDAINIQSNYLGDFEEKHFGVNGKKSDQIIAQSLDSKWVGLSIDIMMDYCEDNQWDNDEIMVNVLGDDDVINEGKLEFCDLFQHYQRICKSTKFEPLFDFNIYTVIGAFISLKKNMIKYIMINIPDFYDDEKQEMDDNKLDEFKKNMFFFIDKQININPKYIQIRTLWNLSVAELRSESIVESICSVLKKILFLTDPVETDYSRNITIKAIVINHQETKRYGYTESYRKVSSIISKQYQS